MDAAVLKAATTRDLMEELLDRMEMQNPIAVPMTTAAKLCGVGPGKIKEWMDNDPNFPAIRSGNKKIIIPVDGLRAYVETKGKLREGIRAHSSTIADIVMRNRRERA